MIDKYIYNRHKKGLNSYAQAFNVYAIGGMNTFEVSQARYFVEPMTVNISAFPAYYPQSLAVSSVFASFSDFYHRSARYAVELIGFSFCQNITKENESCCINESITRTD